MIEKVGKLDAMSCHYTLSGGLHALSMRLGSVTTAKAGSFRMAPRAHGDDPHFLEIIRRELRQKLEFDNVLAKCLLIHTQTEIMEPGRDVHAHIPLAVGAA